MELNIDLDEIREIASLGIRRAAVFMGLGINAAFDPKFTQYQLPDISPIQIVPPDANPQTITAYKESFALWIVGCGLRELMESFAVFLDHVYYACLSIQQFSTGIEDKKFAKKMKDFDHKGPSEKLLTLQNEFSIRLNESKPEMLSSICQARNCLTHRRGVVGHIDCRPGTNLVIRWASIQIYAETEKDKIPLPYPLPPEGFDLPQPNTLKAEWHEKKKKFNQGDVLEFTPAELLEVCLLVNLASQEIALGVRNFAESSGIPINSEPPNSIH